MPTGVYTRTPWHLAILKQNGPKISAANMGRSTPSLRGELNPSKRPEVRAKISAAKKGKPSFNKGKSNWWLKGELHPNWKGGITVGKENKKIYKSKETYKALLKGYGLTLDQYDLLSKEQGDVCRICGTKNKDGGVLSVDHDHRTGKIRGLLCRKCNTGLGIFSDDISFLRKAISYLESFKDPQVQT